jgi:hypothetical protein
MSRTFYLCLLYLLLANGQQPEPENVLRRAGLPGTISDVAVPQAPEPLPPTANVQSRDVDIRQMAGWALRHLTMNPRPSLDYEPVFFIRPLEVPPAPSGHDPIVPGDTDCRMDWEFRYMREILGIEEPGPVERNLHKRVLSYLREDGLAWVPPGHYTEGEVYQGKEVGDQRVVSTWATAKILRSLAEQYRRTRDDAARQRARKAFLALRRLAEWDAGRAYYPGGSGAWLNGKWIRPQMPTAIVEPLVTYWEATQDSEALAFARAVAEGLLADAELLPQSNVRLHRSGEFHGHMHSTLHGVWGVAHLGAVTRDMHFIEWAKNVYDYANQFSTGTGWISAALWNDPIREVSETCATSDMVSIASWLARAGFPAYWDHVERTLRNYLRHQQFFVTTEYEALYRNTNSEKPAEEVEAGLARMRELQGGFMGGPAPNDWINWIGSPRQCGPYNTAYGCMGMFGCCIPEGMRALHTVWSGIVTSSGGDIFVNLSLPRQHQAAAVLTRFPEAGQVDVVARQAGNFFLRPPGWAPRKLIRVLRSGRNAEVQWGGPATDYVVFPNVKRGEVLTLAYPLVTFTQTVAIWPSKPDLELTILWKGNSVTDMLPKGKGLPIDFSSPLAIPALPSN